MRKAIAAGVIVIVAALYLSGRLDPVLYKVGLNFKACGENGYGAVFCGSALTSYNSRVHAVQQQVTAIQQHARTEECQIDPAFPGC